ncbi:hypothetical protein H5410_060375, partial [Solanum commersonii]
MGQSVDKYDIPQIKQQSHQTNPIECREIIDEMSVNVPAKDVDAQSQLNQQAQAFNTILERVNSETPGLFFVDGPGGTGKTFLYRALLAKVRSKGMIALATTTSGVAAAILPGGRTTYSRFGIPLQENEMTMTNMSKQGGGAQLIRQAKLIIWDEAPIAKRNTIETVDKIFRDTMDKNTLFGGKIMVLGGDFRRFACGTKIYKSRDGRCNGDINPEESLVREIFSALEQNYTSAEYITERAILASRNEFVDKLNAVMIEKFPGETKTYISFDSAEDDANNYYQEEYLNTLTPNGLPPHRLVLKENAPIMLLRNLDPSNGLCNGTWLICRGFDKN